MSRLKKIVNAKKSFCLPQRATTFDRVAFGRLALDYFACFSTVGLAVTWLAQVEKYVLFFHLNTT